MSDVVGDDALADKGESSDSLLLFAETWEYVFSAAGKSRGVGSPSMMERRSNVCGVEYRNKPYDSTS